MGKKTRKILAKRSERESRFLDSLKSKSAPKKGGKRHAEITLPKVCSAYPRLRPMEDFKCCSYGTDARAAALIRYFFCEYPVQAWLIDWLLCQARTQEKALSASLIMRLIHALGLGHSPREILKPFLSKAEMAVFFNLARPADLNVSIFAHFVYCKAKARGLEKDAARLMGRIASQQAKLGGGMLKSFWDAFIVFCARVDASAIAIQDIWDYLCAKRLQGTFSFKGRTLGSVLNLVNAWHEELNRERLALGIGKELYKALSEQQRQERLNTRYKPCPAAKGYARHDKSMDRTVEVVQLMEYRALVNEGRAMHNCVASYHAMCMQGDCSIFSLRINQEPAATIEVRGDAVVQARGHCNSRLVGYPLKALLKWVKACNLKDDFIC